MGPGIFNEKVIWPGLKARTGAIATYARALEISPLSAIEPDERAGQPPPNARVWVLNDPFVSPVRGERGRGKWDGKMEEVLRFYDLRF